ncbi:MAG TPA: GH32 C-terminal domain-containing protein, partial [Candidatus Lachnoclostridium stercorigallinarum]|nr:GH32 C-terminal domain-containing protein [Candidatus Lachnoclostridium stercorigallinarum]
YFSVDRGFDFYAPQSFEDENGRRILIGWMGIPEADYTNPTAKAGWQHALTLPRQLHVRDGRLIQTPLEELKALRTQKWTFEGAEDLNGSGEYLRTELGPVFEAELEFSRCRFMKLQLRQGVCLSWEDGVLTLSLEEGGWGRTVRHGKADKLTKLQIFSDVSSLEIFVNGGEQVFSTRVYADCGQEKKSGGYLLLEGDCGARSTVYRLSPFVIEKRDRDKRIV